MREFGWTRLIAAALRQGLSPEIVWGLTPRELLACLMVEAGGEEDASAKHGLRHRELQALLARFPDVPTGSVRAKSVMPKRKEKSHV